MKRLGIDIGSKTIKVMLVDADTGEVLHAHYRPHRSQVKEYLLESIRTIIWQLGDVEATITVTGSAGFRVAELFGVPFVQEVVALRRAVLSEIPQADVILEMGGEDTKLIYLTGTPEQRMNTICAGGTGSFIEMMAGLMGMNVDRMQRLATGYSTIYPIASRCAVFAKSDVRPLLNAGARKEDVAASVLEAVCTQAVAGLSAGRPIEGTVALLGGPFEHIPALRDAFIRVTGFDPDDVILPRDAHLFVVRGAALADQKSRPMMLSDFEERIAAADFENEGGMTHLEPLFASQEDYFAFCDRHNSCQIPRGDLKHGKKNLFLGIDAGSTTMKLALVDDEGALCAYEYDWNEGDVMVSLTSMLDSIYAQLEGNWVPDHVLRSACIIGYGEDFCKAAYCIDESEVETVAHLRAALALEPDVDFLMDIGGQDIKCFYIEEGMISDIVLNEACSSGCGSLFDSIARSMHNSKTEFAKKALFAENPVDLGTRCSTFMDSRVKHAQKEGTPVEDIAAGVCYATARNALFKVVRQPDFSKVGKHVVVQGGAFANDALLRAFELETGADVVRPDLSQLMGAWGAALLMRDKWLKLREDDPAAAEAQRSTLVDRHTLNHLDVRRQATRCSQCANHCNLFVSRFLNDDDDTARAFVTGNRCEKGLIPFGVQRPQDERRPNMLKMRNGMLAIYDRALSESDLAAPVVMGIPRVLALYESYPFWATFFHRLGVPVVPEVDSDDDVYRAGMGSIPAEGACYPSKLLYGHAARLAQAGATALFVPRMRTAFAREGLLGLAFDQTTSTCPLVEDMPDMLAGNVKGHGLDHVSLVSPDLYDARSLDEAAEPLAQALAELGLDASPADVRQALQQARDEYRRFFETLARAHDRALARVDAGEFAGALVMGHAYHADPGINHGIDEVLERLGFAVFDQIDYGFLAGTEAGAGEEGPQADASAWTENDRTLRTVELSHAHPDLHLVMLRSFGCGIDALVADRVHDAVHEHGRIYAELKLDQITDLAAVRIRLRSLAYANQQRSGQNVLASVTATGRTAEQVEEFRRKHARLRRGEMAHVRDSWRNDPRSEQTSDFDSSLMYNLFRSKEFAALANSKEALFRKEHRPEHYGGLPHKMPPPGVPGETPTSLDS